MKKFILLITLALFTLLVLPTSAQNNPQITSFSSSVSSISASSIASGTALIPVSWEVSNRPENSNLVFEQVLPDGTVRNAELPRDFVLVDSIGTGTVVPVMPENNPENLVFRLRLVSLPYEDTLVSQSLTVAIDYQNQVDTTSQLSITSFSVDNNYVVPGANVTFSWEIAGDFREAEIYYGLPRLGYEHVTITEIDSSTGSFTFSLGDVPARLAIAFVLEAVDSNGVKVQASVAIYESCYEWGMNVQDSDCAAAPIETINGVYQDFERGFMLWLPSETLQYTSIWVFYDNGIASYTPDFWNGSSYASRTAPQGLISPERGFGYLWYSNPDMQASLGWATANEQSYIVQFQQSRTEWSMTSSPRQYFQLPDGRIIRVGMGVDWKAVSRWQYL